MAKGPTVYDVAERAGVSIATVSFTFKQPHRVKESTRALVHSAAQELGYLPSGSARGLARGRTGVLGIYSFDYYALNQPLVAGGASGGSTSTTTLSVSLNADNANDTNFRLFPLYVDEIQRGVALECWHRGYNLMVSGGHQPPEGRVADIAGQVDGLAVFARSVPNDVLARIAQRMPVVELSEPAHNDTLSHVTVANAAGVFSLTEHLVRVHGRRNLQFAGPADASSDFQARFGGFQAALQSVGITPPREILTFGAGTSMSADDLVHSLIARDIMPEGFVCALDEYALQLMDALRRAGIDVPRQIAVTGFDGIVAGQVYKPSLTTVRQPMEAMGRLAAQMLIARLERPDVMPENQQLAVTVQLRESCGC